MKFPALVKLAIASLFLVFCFFLAKTPVFAQANPVQQLLPKQTAIGNLPNNTEANVSNNLHNWTQTVLIETLSAMSCTLAGMDPTNPNQPCLGIDQASGKIGYVKNGGGAIGILASNLSLIYTPPLRTGDYFGYLSQSFGTTKPSFAADHKYGLGFDQLSPVLNIWLAFRNITYAFFVIVFLVIGLAIMLRVRIDPRTVMTIQNQIPKIIIGIVLVTFSYAIAGFLIDLMWSSMYISYTTLSAVPNSGGLVGLDPASMQGNTPMGIMDSFTTGLPGGKGVFAISNNLAVNLQDVFRNSLGITHCSGPGGPWDVAACIVDSINPFNLIGHLFATVTSSGGPINVLLDLGAFTAALSVFTKAFPIIKDSVASTEGFLSWIPVVGGSGPVAAGISSAVIAGAAYGIVEYTLRNFLPWLIIFVIIYLSVFVSLIRLWFELLKAFLFVIFDVILAPFWIVAGLIPGNTGVTFGSWLKDLIANLAVFPAVAVMLMLGNIIMRGFSQSASPFIPPLIGNPGNQNFIASLIGLAVILSAPSVSILVKKAIKAPNIGIGSVAQGISAGTSVISGGAKAFGRAYFKTPKQGERRGLIGAFGGFFGQ